MPPAFSALYTSHAGAHILTESGEVLALPLSAVGPRFGDRSVIVCHAPFTLNFLGDGARLKTLDVLELFAFVYPGKFLVPSVLGLAQALGFDAPEEAADYPLTIHMAAMRLLDDLSALDLATREILYDLATYMGQGGRGWVWASWVLSALNIPPRDASAPPRDIFARMLARLPDVPEPPPLGPHSYDAVAPEAAEARLNLMLHHGGVLEDRADQRAYAGIAARAFQAPAREGEMNLQVIEAGTGIGKTLGYLAPATLWAEQNATSVWVSTYTKNLQKQLDQELRRLPVGEEDRARYAVTRKGRENYLCLLNFAEFAAGAALRATPQAAVAAGLMLRWVMATRDGDFTGVDYPGWLTTILTPANTVMLADRRGECIHAGCEFYHRCFIERSIRRARTARVVVANHTLAMIEAARADADDRLPGYMVFDEGHHLLDAADQVFSTGLSAREGFELRRWLIGVEGGRKSRLRGIKRRLEDLAPDTEGQALVDEIVQAARVLPDEHVLEKINQPGDRIGFAGVLALVAAQVRARSDTNANGYSLETPAQPMDESLRTAVEFLGQGLRALQKPMLGLIASFQRKLRDEAHEMSTDQRNRLQAAMMGLERRANQILPAWLSLIDDVAKGVHNPDFIDWMEITRIEGRVIDVGIFRHWRNPLRPLSEVMRTRLKGAVITSATLRDRSDDGGWDAGRAATGADLLSGTPEYHAFPSPFDYAAQTRVIVVTDVVKGDMNAVAGAYRALFAASGGGALGLFTAINRLRAVHRLIVGPLAEGGLHLYAQHVDKMDNGTLVDLFRADRHACLLGTDAMRDGVDVPGDSLRLLVYDRVPWPLATLLHKARRDEFGGRAYDEQLTRLRLKQAYGRLVRRAGDRGVFVMLDSGLPTRLTDAFPNGVSVERVGLAQAVEITRGFLSGDSRLLQRIDG